MQQQEYQGTLGRIRNYARNTAYASLLSLLLAGCGGGSKNPVNPNDQNSNASAITRLYVKVIDGDAGISGKYNIAERSAAINSKLNKFSTAAKAGTKAYFSLDEKIDKDKDYVGEKKDDSDSVIEIEVPQNAGIGHILIDKNNDDIPDGGKPDVDQARGRM